jgi:Phage integrase family
MVSTAIHEAGLPDRCKPHGLRKAAARRLAEAGCSASEIAAITGHKTLAEVERYTRAADQVRLAQQAIRKQIETGSGKLRSDEVANDDSEALKINSLMANLALPRGIQTRRQSTIWLDVQRLRFLGPIASSTKCSTFSSLTRPAPINLATTQSICGRLRTWRAPRRK